MKSKIPSLRERLGAKSPAKKLVPAKKASEEAAKPAVNTVVAVSNVVQVCGTCMHFKPEKPRCKRNPPDQNIRFSATQYDESCGEWWDTLKSEAYWKAKGL